MMKKTPKISESEWEVMKALWLNAPVTSMEIVTMLAPHTDWKPNTIKTLLARLVKKEAVKTEKSGREFLYSPVVTESQCIRAESKSFLSRVYRGNVMPLIAGFIQDEKLSKQEIADLRQLLDDLEKE